MTRWAVSLLALVIVSLSGGCVGDDATRSPESRCAPAAVETKPTSYATRRPRPTRTPISLGDDGGQIIELRTRLEPIDVEEFPLNNCNGSAPFRATERRSKTVWQQVDLELEGEVGLGFLLTLRLGSVYGVKDGESETRSYEITFEVASQSFVVYTVVWYDVWMEGEIKFPTRDEGIGYRIRKGIIFELDGGRVEPGL